MVQATVTAEELRERILGLDGPETWTSSRVSYLESLKASRVMFLEGYDSMLRMLGVTEDTAKVFEPLVIHFLALVYQADLAYEEAQLNGDFEVDLSWRRDMEELLESYGLLDERGRERLDDLQRYFELEGRLLLGKVEVTEESVYEVLSIRSSDIALVTPLMLNLLGTDPRVVEEMVQVSKPLYMLWEIADDVPSYAKDIAAGSYSTIRMYARIFGAERGRVKLEEFRSRLVERACAEIDRVSVPTMLLVLASAVPDWLLPVLRKLPRPVLARILKTIARQDKLGRPELPVLIDEK
ncbi:MULTISPECIES: hypothetical protein [unclassified Crossiella]|uniref:hypothetical protein n=1 Tax=unclassified Crossiella TaxID=2620835 RepID=UPI0020000610|nr:MULTISPECIES: hypothetical protein [unclassified Crossiella]MCK2240128.1 hypothetical protein [Crossiella sp. S99.2]MCK2253420.1 hypothetical protein [Crossiella sp. S99.1]